MINIFVTYDEKDSDIGYYCEACKSDLEQFLNEQENIQVVYISSDKCNHAYISLILENRSYERFIFVAYSHGNSNGESLLCNRKAYLDTYNAHLFADSMVYAMACSAGEKLGKELIRRGCKIFVGFDKEVRVLEAYKDLFKRCDNWALTLFLGKDISITDAVESMKLEFTKQIDYLEEIHNDYISASWLTENRDSLVLYGNKNLTRNDFITIV